MILYSLNLPDLQVNFSLGEVGNELININEQQKIRVSNRFSWDGRVDYKVEDNDNSYSVLKNSIIEMNFDDPAPIFVGDKIIWITNNNISAKFFCNDNHTSFVKIHNVSSL